MSSRGIEAAYGRRHPVGRFTRRAVNRGLRVLSSPLDRDRVDYIHVWPPVRDERDFADVVARVNWHFAEVTMPIYIPGVRGRAPDPTAAPYMDPDLVRTGRWTDQQPAGRPRYLWRDLTLASALHQLPRIRRSTVADPTFSYTSELGYRRLREALAPGRPATAGVERLAQRAVPGGTALVLGTGPSASEVDPDRVTADLRIVCNSAVRNHELMRSLRPDVITIADPVFHFGPSRYAAAFRDDLHRAVEETGALVAVPDYFAGLMDAHCPDLRAHLVAVPTGSETWVWQTGPETRVRDTGNILTFLMLPIALALADTVEIAGCDGRQPTENYFWKHNASTQYSDDLMRDVFEAHPAFFRYRSYADYYDRHCALLADLLAAAEREGKRFRAVTSSWIPALTARGAIAPSG